MFANVFADGSISFLVWLSTCVNLAESTALPYCQAGQYYELKPGLIHFAVRGTATLHLFSRSAYLISLCVKVFKLYRESLLLHNQGYLPKHKIISKLLLHLNQQMPRLILVRLEYPVIVV